MYLLSSNVVGFGQNPRALVPWGRMAIIGRALASSCCPIRPTETSSGSPVPSLPRPRPPGEKPWRWKSTSTVSALAGSAFGIMTTARPVVTPPAASGVMSDTGPHLPVSGSSTLSFASSCLRLVRIGLVDRAGGVAPRDPLDRDPLHALVARRVTHVAGVRVPRLGVDVGPSDLALDPGCRRPAQERLDGRVPGGTLQGEHARDRVEARRGRALATAGRRHRLRRTGPGRRRFVLEGHGSRATLTRGASARKRGATGKLIWRH